MRGLITFTALCLAPAIGTAATATLSPQAQLGRQIFFDPTLSASGKLSCASCHDPTNAYAAPKASGVVIRGGANMDRPGLRAVPSLRYLSDTPRFSRHTYMDMGRDREDVGPAGGFMLDGRADNLREQMLLPLLDPAEMANSSVADVAARLRRTPYAAQLRQAADSPSTSSHPLAGAQPPADARPSAGTQPLVDAAAAALERFELEDPSFHPYNSRFDRYLRGTAALSTDELEGLRLFIDPTKGNCAACHTATTGPGGRAPTFTDYSFHALGVPRNPAIPANADPRFFDLGLCGPRRTDLHNESQYCGYFKTPTLRNVARRQFFFHNGQFANLQDVMHFYVERDTDARRWYPTLAGKLQQFDDVPTRYRGNVNISDAPLNRSRGDQPALDDDEIGKVIVFLGTLN
ncbi:MAG: cytochrome c family protein, partial [Gammaproteobacteria bacterium]|nr:cytochrome c family protein [Gammaproteobacteria bacterium]